MVLPRLSKGP
ncbi:hypothetical protein GQ607_007490 [Colletotrichum asianum]|uniref:Uncharacterized protein n=1 Tax=Colletotrichum asianum TaxID=702518 RepID=A0A8H3ZMV2_9PEZI|nr:hypothetical protein GQ607_007490 [Colletotrichum asianum]